MKKFLFSGLLFAGILCGIPGAMAFTDEGQSAYPEAVEYVFEKGLMTGYVDGTFKPKAVLTRAEGLAVLVKLFAADELADFSASETCFNDTPAGEWTAPIFCLSLDKNWLAEAALGRPSDPLNLAEAAKLVKMAYEWNFEPSDPWYQGPLEALGSRGAIPSTFSYIGEPMTREEWAEILWRLEEDLQDKDSKEFGILKEGVCSILNEESVAGVDLNSVRESWLSWTNSARAGAGLHAYSYNPQLHRSATVWSQEARTRGNITHQRNSGDAYYDYYKIKSWFSGLGLDFKNVSGVTFTENIGWGPYSCSTGDCTEKLTNAVRSTFDFYMNEVGLAYRPHYNSVMNAVFDEIGFGIAIDTVKKRYYLTIHYGTEITSNPAPLCD